MSTPDPNSDRRKPESGGAMDTFVKAESLLQLAFVLPAAVLIGWGGGVLLDKWLHQDWIYIVGLIFGWAAGRVEGVRQALRAGKPKDE